MPRSITNKILKNLDKPIPSRNVASHQGLCLDLLVIKRVLECVQPQAKIRRVSSDTCGHGLNIRLPPNKRYRIHVEHIEDVTPDAINVLIPNHELVWRQDLALLDQMDYVLCKTHYGYKAFKRLLGRRKKTKHVRLIYVGFTGIPGIPPRANIRRDYDECLHLAGKSWMKNTGAILDAWRQDWPCLTIVCVDYCARTHLTKKRKQKCKSFQNIILHTKFLSFKDVSNLRKRCGIHFLISEQEGFGMYIQESMMTGALCLYSDHPPMSEFFPSGTGIPVKGKRFRHNEGVLPITGIKPSPRDITAAMNRVMRMSDKQKDAIGKLAQKQFYINRHRFVNNAVRTFGKIMKDHHSPNPSTKNLSLA